MSLLYVKALSRDITKAESSLTVPLLQKKALEHELVHLQQLMDEGKTVIEIPKDRHLQDRAKLMLEVNKIPCGCDLSSRVLCPTSAG
ncbi:MAG: hypothetical protein PSN37_01995 [Alphaproteobacteria bacterium]|nr:hypothetical protein [Alphaproteobacteria bacterium]